MKNGRQLSHPHIIQRIRDAGHKIVVHDPKAEPLDLFSAPECKYYPALTLMFCSGILISDRLRAKHAMRNHDGHGYPIVCFGEDGALADFCKKMDALGLPSLGERKVGLSDFWAACVPNGLVFLLFTEDELSTVMAEVRKQNIFLWLPPDSMFGL